LTAQSYTNNTNRQTPKRRKDPIRAFYSRLHYTLTALGKIQKQLPAEVWARFAAAYSQHWMYSLDLGEKAAAPANYYAEWAEAQSLCVIEMDADTSVFHSARNYHVYESPRARARQVLGCHAEGEAAYV